MRRATLLAAAALAVLALPAVAQAGTFPAPSLTLDSSFSPPSGVARSDFVPGTTSTPKASATDGDRIYSVGESGSGAAGDVAIEARHADGTLDTGFNGTGQLVVPVSTTTEDAGVDIVVLPDHRLRILVATGSSGSSQRDGAILGLNPDGSMDTSFGASAGGRPGIETFAAAFGGSSGNPPEIPVALAVAPDGRLAATGDVAQNSNDDTIVWMLNGDGTPDTAFGTGGVVTIDRSGNASADAGRDLAFRPGGGVVVLIQVGAPGAASDPVLHAYTDTGATDVSFSGSGDEALHIGDAPTIPNAMLLYDGSLWITGKTNTGADTNAFIARVAADGSGLQSRQFDMRGQLVGAGQAVTSVGTSLAIAPGIPDTVVVGGSEDPGTGLAWAAAAFNGIDGDLSAMGFGDVALPVPQGSSAISGVSAGDGWVAITGPYRDTVNTFDANGNQTGASTITRFGDAKLLIDAEKACNLGIEVTRPLELDLLLGQASPADLHVVNAGTKACSGTITTPAAYGMTYNGVHGPIATGVIVPNGSFTASGVQIGYLGPLKPQDTLTFTLAAPGDSDTSDNTAALHVRFDYCDLTLRPTSRPSFVPSEGTRKFGFAVGNAGTATCADVHVGVAGSGRRGAGERGYRVQAGKSVTDTVAAGLRRRVKLGSRVRMVFSLTPAGDPRRANGVVTLSPRVLAVGDTDAGRPRGAAAVIRGIARRGRGPAKARQLRVTRVDVAVRRLGHGCRWLASSHGRFRTRHVAAKGHCAPVWLKARGTRRWRLATGGLPPGRYQLRSRATIGVGFREASFTKHDHDLVDFRVR